MSALPAVDGWFPHLARVAERLREATVEVRGAGAGGAGILWAPDLVITNAHVVRASRVRIGLADGREVPGELVAADRRADLALLGVPRSGVAPATLGDSDALRVGALVVALGHPLGWPRTLTAGVVHALATARPTGRRWIHADVRLAPGNSGGPLADAVGRVVGVITMMAAGLAVAIPINEARRFVVSTGAGGA